MSEVPGISGEEPTDRSSSSSEDIKRYQESYNKSLDLFQKSFKEYIKTDEQNKQDAFKKVMDSALNIMNETASVILKGNAQSKEQELEKSYETFKNDPSPENEEKVESDIAALKESLKKSP